MTEPPEGTPAEPTAKHGDAAWREHRDAISDRNVQARKRGNAERKVALSRVTERRRLDALRESERLQALNAKLDKARASG
ncbi:MAG: hypothetical protein ACRDJY_05090 [Thermoleophilaceae bacterium]